MKIKIYNFLLFLTAISHTVMAKDLAMAKTTAMAEPLNTYESLEAFASSLDQKFEKAKNTYDDLKMQLEELDQTILKKEAKASSSKNASDIQKSLDDLNTLNKERDDILLKIENINNILNQDKEDFLHFLEKDMKIFATKEDIEDAVQDAAELFLAQQKNIAQDRMVLNEKNIAYEVLISDLNQEILALKERIEKLERNDNHTQEMKNEIEDLKEQYENKIKEIESIKKEHNTLRLHNSRLLEKGLEFLHKGMGLKAILEVLRKINQSKTP